MEAVFPSLKKLWTEWQLRTLILLSLTFQIVLIVLGPRRKYIRKFWINMLVWSAYLAADFVATAALGVITSNLFENCAPLDANMQLTAFWAPFLLLHLGGPDTITAYAVEDNELWRRHLLQFVFQTGVAFYIFLMAWTGSVLSVLAIPMMLVGLMKYGERTWVLWSASHERRRDSISEHDPDEVQIAGDREEGSSTRSRGQMSMSRALPAEGILGISRSDYDQQAFSSSNNIPAAADGMPSSDRDQQDSSDAKLETNPVPDDEGNDLLVAAYGLLDIITKRFFVDAEPTTADRETSDSVLNRVPPNNGFRVIEMELGFMYDMLYTKRMVTHTLWGIALRFTSFLVTCVVLVSLYSLAYHMQSYSKIDLNLTLLLLTAAIFLELYAALILLVSDQTVVWMRKHNRTNILRAITSLRLRLFRNRAWSNTMGQYSLLSHSAEEKPISISYRVRLLRNLPRAFREFSYLSMIKQKLEKEQYEGYRKVPEALKELMFKYFQEELLNSYEGQLGGATLQRLKFILRTDSRFLSNPIHNDRWSKNLVMDQELEFDQRITVWHIATELGYYLDHGLLTRTKKNTNHGKMSKYISRYMMYLVRTSPNLLPPGEAGSGEFSIQNSYYGARKVMREYFNSEAGINDNKQATRKERKINACKHLLSSENSSAYVTHGLQFSLMPHACLLLKNLRKEEPERRWRTIWGVWMGMLSSASIDCRGIQHARKLAEGGELLTHASLLMAHFNYVT